MIGVQWSSTHLDGNHVALDLADLALAGLDALGEFLQLGTYLAEGDRRLELTVAALQLVQLWAEVHAHHGHLLLQTISRNIVQIFLLISLLNIVIVYYNNNFYYYLTIFDIYKFLQYLWQFYLVYSKVYCFKGSEKLIFWWNYSGVSIIQVQIILIGDFFMVNILCAKKLNFFFIYLFSTLKKTNCRILKKLFFYCIDNFEYTFSIFFLFLSFNFSKY